MKKILIVEDDIFLGNAYRVKLSKEGFDATVLTDGEEALTFLESTIPDLILLDLMMPIKDGFSTLEDIRKNPDWKEIPIIITSNLGQTEDISRGMSLGATDYIVKSNIPLSELIIKINTLISKKK